MSTGSLELSQTTTSSKHFRDSRTGERSTSPFVTTTAEMSEQFTEEFQRPRFRQLPAPGVAPGQRVHGASEVHERPFRELLPELHYRDCACHASRPEEHVEGS